MNICVLDIGGTFIKGALMDEEAHLLKQWKVKSRTADLDSFLESLDQSIAPYLEGAKGIAVSMPGKIDSAAGIARTGGAFLFSSHFSSILRAVASEAGCSFPPFRRLTAERQDTGSMLVSR